MAQVRISIAFSVSPASARLHKYGTVGIYALNFYGVIVSFHIVRGTLVIPMAVGTQSSHHLETTRGGNESGRTSLKSVSVSFRALPLLLLTPLA